MFDCDDFAHEHIRTADVVDFVEIRRYAFLDVFRLADVQNLAVFVEILVNARIVRERLDL